VSKTILISGCSSGLGVSLAVQAARAGHAVYATMRNLDKRATLDAALADAGATATVLQLDVQDPASVQAAVGEVIGTEQRIDTLINNAGAGFVRTTEQATEDEIRWVLDVNFVGVVRCTKAVLPHMRAARSGHVVTIGSIGGLVGQPFNEIYCAAKFAVEGYTEALASYVTPSFGIHFTVVEPGGISSEFAASVMKQVQATGGIPDDEYRPIAQQYIAGAQKRRGDSSDVFQTPDQVAKVVMRCVESEDPPIRTRTSNWSEQLTRFKTQPDPDGRLQQKMVIDEFLAD